MAKHNVRQALREDLPTDRCPMRQVWIQGPHYSLDKQIRRVTSTRAKLLCISNSAGQPCDCTVINGTAHGMCMALRGSIAFALATRHFKFKVSFEAKRTFLDCPLRLTTLGLLDCTVLP